MTTSEIQEEILSGVTEIDRVVFDRSAFSISNEDQLALQIAFVRATAQYHLERCELFRDYAARIGFDPDDINSELDLGAVPQIPTGVFKRTTVRSGTADARLCASSGTRGNLSVIWRDRETIQRLLGSIQSGIAEFLDDPYEEDVAVINLGPSQEEAGDLWLAYVLGLVELGYETQHMMKDGVLDARAAADAIVAARDRATTIVVIGAPSVMYDVALVCQNDASRHRDDDVRVVSVTAGGWKRQDGGSVDRETFTKTVIEAFGMEGPQDVRDTFNQVELNTVLFECEHGKKHVPPWLHAFTRDTRTFQRQRYGEVGVLSYLDPTALSYPAFIISDDLGIVENKGCVCGRPGKTLLILRRVQRNEHWGCALKVEDLVARHGQEHR